MEAWAKGLRLEDFELLCLDGTRKPVAEAKTCHLAKAPSHAVVSRRDKAEYVERVLLEQQVWTPRASALSELHGPLAGGAITELGQSAHDKPFFPAPLHGAGGERICFMLCGCPGSHEDSRGFCPGISGTGLTSAPSLLSLDLGSLPGSVPSHVPRPRGQLGPFLPARQSGSVSAPESGPTGSCLSSLETTDPEHLQLSGSL